jgi:beta-phosphoglucomutase-like phosphatase (HAD superfamily)
MKLTKEDIQTYGTEDEKEFLLEDEEINPKLKELLEKLQNWGIWYATLDRRPDMDEKVEWMKTMRKLGLEIYQLGVFVGNGGK